MLELRRVRVIPEISGNLCQFADVKERIVLLVICDGTHKLIHLFVRPQVFEYSLQRALTLGGGKVRAVIRINFGVEVYLPGRAVHK